MMTLAEAAAAVRVRRVSPVELTRACLARIGRLNPSLNAFIEVAGDQALAEAKRLEGRRPAGPLHGVPVALKDLIDVAGMKTTAGSALRKDHVADRDAEVVTRLRAAGAIILGKLNMDEFAYNFTSETSYFGRVPNPWNRDRIPGGSSGGSAVAVAARLCFGALGSDTGGSIRLPAALCGIVGLKPAYGAVSTQGVVPLAWSMDHVGPMARNARDAALLLEGMTGRAYPLERRTSSWRIGVVRRMFFDGIDAGVAREVEAAIAAVGRIAAGVRDIELPALPEMPVIRAEAWAYHEPRLAADAARYHPHTLHEIREGEPVKLGAYARALRDLERVRREIAAVFREVDFVLTPACPLPACKFDSKPEFIYLRNSMPFNFFGIPSASIPCGFTDGGLPVGLQISAPAEARVLSLAHAYESVTEWTRRVPPGID